MAQNSSNAIQGSPSLTQNVGSTVMPAATAFASMSLNEINQLLTEMQQQQSLLQQDITQEINKTAVALANDSRTSILKDAESTEAQSTGQILGGAAGAIAGGYGVVKSGQAMDEVNKLTDKIKASNPVAISLKTEGNSAAGSPASTTPKTVIKPDENNPASEGAGAGANTTTTGIEFEVVRENSSSTSPSATEAAQGTQPNGPPSATQTTPNAQGPSEDPKELSRQRDMKLGEIDQINSGTQMFSNVLSGLANGSAGFASAQAQKEKADSTYQSTLAQAVLQMQQSASQTIDTTLGNLSSSQQYLSQIHDGISSSNRV